MKWSVGREATEESGNKMMQNSESNIKYFYIYLRILRNQLYFLSNICVLAEKYWVRLGTVCRR